MKPHNISHRKAHNNKLSIAFHEAGHAIAICLNNQVRQQPPIFFQIVLKKTSIQVGLIDLQLTLSKA